MSRQKRVLILSSLNPTVGSGTVALDFYRAFAEAGYVVDLLTLAPVDGHPEFMSVYNRRPGKFHHLGFRLWKNSAVQMPTGSIACFTVENRYACADKAYYASA